MARKSIHELKSVAKLTADAVEEWESVSLIKYELAKTAYDAQDAETQEAIDRIVKTLQTYATGYINVQLQPPIGAMVPVKVSAEYLGYNLLFLAVEIAKDLGFVGIRLANFVFPETLCASCGAELIRETRTTKGRGKRG
jgi:hypothetical protein